MGLAGRACQTKTKSKEKIMYKKMIMTALAVASFAPAANALDVPANVSAVIQQAITANEDVPMNFGNIIPNATAEKIATLSAAGEISGDGLSYSGTTAAAEFSITAAPSTQMNITFADGTLTSDANSMTLDTFQTSSVPASNTTDASGDLAVRVGANLNVGANQAPGTYNGTYTMMVNY